MVRARGNIYEICYRVSTIMELDNEGLANSFIDFISDKLSEINEFTEANITMHYIEDPDYEFQYDYMDNLIADKLLELQSLIYNIAKGTNNIHYLVSSSMYLVSKDYESEDDMQLADEDDIYHIDDEDQNNDNFQRTYSRIFVHADNNKKNIKNHGIIISSSKKDRRKDEEIIKAFLKEFIPGKAPWIKRYRSMVLDRWMRLYVISKKNAKRYKEEISKKRSYKNRKIISNHIGKIKRIVEKYDPFYDHAR
jgi:hypothetical protein